MNLRQYLPSVIILVGSSLLINFASCFTHKGYLRPIVTKTNNALFSSTLSNNQDTGGILNYESEDENQRKQKEIAMVSGHFHNAERSSNYK